MAMPNWLIERMNDMGTIENMPVMKIKYVAFSDPTDDGVFPELEANVGGDDSDDENYAHDYDKCNYVENDHYQLLTPTITLSITVTNIIAHFHFQT